MALITIPRLAVTGVLVLISILAYGSQLLFQYMEPGPLSRQEAWYFNTLIGCIWISYARACLSDPGNLKSHSTKQPSKGDNANNAQDIARWCKKCDSFKPPRAHHCKVCNRCIPKMDHHCPWTANCVSHTTFPHFIRFLFYACASMIKLGSYQLDRLAIIWESRNLPSYLGPSRLQLGALFMLCALNSFTIFGVGIIFIRTIYSLATNVTAIESWEIERHETLVRRARKHGGYLDGPNGRRIRIVKQEFPYDIGIWSNICQGMCGGPFSWFWVFARTPSVESGLSFEVNDFEDPGTIWPPPDPDKMPRSRRSVGVEDIAHELGENFTDQDRLRAFKERQEADFRRRAVHRSWADSEGQKLEDFGVDDENEVPLDEDDIPIGQLISKRRSNI